MQKFAYSTASAFGRASMPKVTTKESTTNTILPGCGQGLVVDPRVHIGLQLLLSFSEVYAYRLDPELSRRSRRVAG